MRLIDIVTKAIATLTLIGVVNAANAQRNWTTPVHYQTKDGRDSIIIERYKEVNGQVYRIESDGNVTPLSNASTSRNSGLIRHTNPDGSVTAGFYHPETNNNSSSNKTPEPVGDGSFKEVRVNGYSFGSKGHNNLEEATVDAYRKAIEKGTGISIQSFTNVENYQLKKDQITSKARGMLLPGFQVVEVGYGTKGSNQTWNDGVYKVTLIGKVKENNNQQSFMGEFEKGQACYGQKDYVCAKDHFEKAANLDPNNPEIIFRLAQSYRWLGKDFFDRSLQNYYLSIENEHKKGYSYACIAGIYSSKFYHSQSKEKTFEALKKGAEYGNHTCIDILDDFDNFCKKSDMK